MIDDPAPTADRDRTPEKPTVTSTDTSEHTPEPQHGPDRHPQGWAGGMPPVPGLTAAAVILGGYLLFFADGVATAVLIAGGDATARTLDYSSVSDRWSLPVSDVGQIAGACLLLWLALKWLQTPATAVGIGGRPRWRQTFLTVGVAVAAMVVAQLVIAALSDPAAPSTNQPLAANGWAALRFLSALRAGVTEEFIIVAIPVLLGLRAGWSRPAILALSIALRWPFHVYHGTLSSLPWAIIWGGAFAAAFLTWRRLLPLVAVHTWWDCHSVAVAVWGDGASTGVDITGLLAVLVILLFWYQQRRAALNPDEPKVTDPGPFRIIRRHIPREGPLYAIGSVGFAAYLAWMLTIFVSGAWSFTALFGISLGASVLALVALFTVSWTSNAWTYRDAAGETVGMLLWHTDGDGAIWVDGYVGARPQNLAGELAGLAAHVGQNVSVSGRLSTLGRGLTKIGHAHQGRGLATRIVVPPSKRAPDLT